MMLRIHMGKDLVILGICGGGAAPALLPPRMMSDYNVEMLNDGLGEFNVELHGPEGSLYEGSVWKVHVELPDSYPYKSPSIGFVNKILHPNIDELSGGVCLDVINESWSPMFAYCDRYAKKENTTTAAVEEETGTDISDGECTE
ncbi:hypothetical protein RJ639_037644 [Escallonia herrerae]|uniref:UBC core domain-containing protein n=1 Tax=Escallonia herrerae TaxID=1293975 RepID=A0AA88WLK1_9ASTE|nr:hypothetical protein RJ639_037644 [Escallonia herrerae]